MTEQLKSDEQIQRDVLEELKWDSRVNKTDVGVTVSNGIVVLRGIVTSYGEKLAAQEAAHRVVGVLDVANELEVSLGQSESRTDIEIARAVRLALEWDVWVPDPQVQSAVSKGWVTLEGKVGLMRERNDAERAIRNLAGVRGVTNRIEVIMPSIEPEEVREVIEEALDRRAHRKAERIRIDVKDGVVTLRGRVRSWQEKRAVLGAVSHAPGVWTVSDHLIINPYG
jgi:osmotically-inducible protein OsmY